MNKEEDAYDDEEGARPSSLRPVHKLSTPDPLYDQQLLRDLAIINERTRKELGPPPQRGVSTKPKPHATVQPSAQPPEAAVVSCFKEGPVLGIKEPELEHKSPENDTMKVQHVAMAAALAVTSAGQATADGNRGSQAAASIHEVREAQTVEPVWPETDIAERELGDGYATWPEGMFVEHVNGKWIAWVLMSPVHGQAKALDFFSGRVENVTVEFPGDYNDSFVDARGVTHRSVIDPHFYFKNPRPGGAVGKHIFVNVDSLEFDRDVTCQPDLHVAERKSSDFKTVIWRKIFLYPGAISSGCPSTVWDSLIGTGLELRDGTMLIVAGKYIFRVRVEDLTPVGRAKNLHVLDESEVLRAIDHAKGKSVNDPSAYLTEKLDLR